VYRGKTNDSSLGRSICDPFNLTSIPNDIYFIYRFCKSLSAFKLSPFIPYSVFFFYKLKVNTRVRVSLQYFGKDIRSRHMPYAWNEKLNENLEILYNINFC
jgi:hypothetical protein